MTGRTIGSLIGAALYRAPALQLNAGRSNIPTALALSGRSNELTAYRNWAYVDTLALGEFKSGNVQRAVELERKALELAARSPRRGEVEQALARFEAALRERVPRD